VAKARFRGQAGFFLVHVEQQAQPPVEFGRRMHQYFGGLHHKYRLPVYPIALFSHGAARPEPGVYQIGFPGFEVLRFQYRVIQLSRLHWRDFLRHHNPVACALMTKMKTAKADRPRVKLECLRLLASLRLDRAKLRFISGFIDTYLRLTAEETLRFQEQADTLLTETEKMRVMELTTSWKEEGRAEGREEGRVEGREEGRAEGREEGRAEGQREASLALVQRQLLRRLGRLPRDAEQRLRILTITQLQRLGEALLDFASAGDLEKWLRRAS
jgi:predicted transposase YdaD